MSLYTLSDSDTMEQDTKIKRAQFVDGCHDLQEEFGRAHPEVQTKLVTLYNPSCYGSSTWNLFGEWTKKLLTSWNVNLKYIWQLPHQTHRYFFEHRTESFKDSVGPEVSSICILNNRRTGKLSQVTTKDRA